MRTFIDVKCTRCGWTSSLEGVDIVTASELTDHVCVDGVRGATQLLSKRVVPGPGRTDQVARREDVMTILIVWGAATLAGVWWATS